MGNFWNFPNRKLLYFQNFIISKIKIWLQKLAIFGIICQFDIPHCSQFCKHLYLPFDSNQFRRFNFTIFISYLSDSRKFSCSTFESSCNFQIRNVRYSQNLLFEILTLILKINIYLKTNLDYRYSFKFCP